jgi:extracellular elastinolytic metalloproteinase
MSLMVSLLIRRGLSGLAKVSAFLSFYFCCPNDHFHNFSPNLTVWLMYQQSFFYRLWLLVCALAFASVAIEAQTPRTPREAALRFLQENPSQFNLSATDVADVRVTDEYASKHNGLTHVWVQQQHLGIPVFNGLFGLHVKPDGEVLHLGHRFVSDLKSQINTAAPSLSAAKALEMAMANLGFTGFSVPNLRSKINDRNFIFEGGAVSKKEIPVSACYAVLNDGKVRLAWSILIDQANTSDMWSIRVDAQTGLIINKLNRTVYCSAGHVHRLGEACAEQAVAQEKTSEAQATNPKSAAVDERYNVFPFPTESPIHGPRQVLTNPADPTASPFGWLDTNGADGAEYTYTRGNNVWAFDDSADDDTPSAAESADAGASLNFDFPFSPTAEPTENQNAAITNLFYVNNAVHDFTYRFGFDEPAGNFQTNNYGNTGAGSDAVLAQALDGSGQNNANFSTPDDGQPGRMQMYLWSRTGLVTVNAPLTVAGVYDATGTNGWGAPITSTPVTGDVVFASDGTGSASLGCNDLIINATGKIVMVDRGECQFGKKALEIQQAGGIGCIICNFEEVPVGMDPGNFGGQVNIPTVLMKKSGCDLIRQLAGNGLNISLMLPAATVPNQVDGSFDNGIIAHEYGHGVSNRLTGGPNNSDCLNNGEQMGEGWSDWLTLVTTLSPGDVAADARGVGAYALRQGAEGRGIRRYPYSTDMAVSPITFGTVAQSSTVHQVGEIWAATLWDLHWAMIEKYGYDANLNNPNSGNARAIQLVIDGMKLQPCSPGFQDGRDAILLADRINYNGADTCLISTVFARRGLGYQASQGSSNNSADGIEDFDPIPTCVKELKINKLTENSLVEPGDNAEFTIVVTNHKEDAATGVVVTDELPAGLTFVSATNGGTASNGMVVWNLGTVQPGQVLNLQYTAKTDAGLGSTRIFRDPMDTDDEWFSFVQDETGSEYFFLQNETVKIGNAAWQASNIATETDFTLETTQSFTVSGSQPAIRFWHRYNTEAGSDAGFLEFKDLDDPLGSWRRVGKDKTFRAGYPGAVQYTTFAIPFLDGFSGNSGDWVQSYIDMSDFAGKNITPRFRFGSDGNTAGDAWYVDELEFLDVFNYDGEACVTSSNGDQACAKAAERGVIVNPVTVGTEEPHTDPLALRVQPNPADELIHLSLGKAVDGAVQVSLVGSDGRLALSQHVEGLSVGQVLTLNVQQLPAGLYLVRLETSVGSSVQKVVIR